MTRAGRWPWVVAATLGCGDGPPLVAQDDALTLRGAPVGVEHTELRATRDGFRLDRTRSWSFADGDAPRPTTAVTVARFDARGALTAWEHRLGDSPPWTYTSGAPGCIAGKTFWPEAGFLGDAPPDDTWVAWTGRACEAGWRVHDGVVRDPAGRVVATLGAHGLPVQRHHGGLVIGGTPPATIPPADPNALLAVPIAGEWPENPRVVELALTGADADAVPGATGGVLRVEVPLVEELPRAVDDDAPVAAFLERFPVRDLPPASYPSGDRVALVRALVTGVRATLGTATSLARPDPSADARGDCNEHTALFVGHARAAGAPARAVAGYLRVGAELRPHTWAEVWFGAAGWVPVDPTWGPAFAAADRVALATGHPDALAPPILRALEVRVILAR